MSKNEENYDIEKIISKNKSDFQLNITLLEIINNNTKNNRINLSRMINIKKYQTNSVIIDHFYKKISRF